MYVSENLWSYSPEDSSDIGRFGGGDIEENDTEEDDFGKDTNFCSGRHQSHSVSNVKT